MQEKKSFKQLVTSLGGKNKSNGAYSCLCPCHDDKEKSLSLKLDGDKLLVHCFAGCSYEAIREKIGYIMEESQEEEKKSYLKKFYKYTYHNEEGNAVYFKRKIRFYDGNTYIGKKQIWFENLKGERGAPAQRYPYNIHLVHQYPDATVIICEGEDDCDNLSLLAPGFVCITNDDGGAKWTDKFDSVLQKRKIIILEDNDKTGRARSAMLLTQYPTARLVRFENMPEKSDVSDFLSKYGLNETIKKIHEAKRPEAITVEKEESDEVREDIEEKPKKEKKKKAKYEDYVSFMKSLVTDTRKDIINGEIFCKLHDEWIPAKNLEDYFKSYSRVHGGFFSPLQFKEHIARLQRDTLEKDFLIDFPKWDGVDRIEQMFELFKFQKMSSEMACELFKHWGAGIFKKIIDPYYQNPTIIIQGNQGLGKDSLVNALCGGLDFYMKNLKIDQHSSTECERMLHTAIVFNISEFDRTAKTDVATLKQILTTPYTNCRLPWDKTDERRMVRASFISTCNISDMLIDSTGNRRYWVFEADYLGLYTQSGENGWMDDVSFNNKVKDSYPGLFNRPEVKAERMQVISQLRQLAEQGYEASSKAVGEIVRISYELTPDDPIELMLSEYDTALSHLNNHFKVNDGVKYFRLEQISEICSKIAKDYGRSKQKFMQLLGIHGRRMRSTQGMIYCAGRLNQEKEEVLF